MDNIIVVEGSVPKPSSQTFKIGNSTYKVGPTGRKHGITGVTSRGTIQYKAHPKHGALTNQRGGKGTRGDKNGPLNGGGYPRTASGTSSKS